MPYTPGNLALISSVNGFGLYRYDTLDAATDVDGSGYFNNASHDLNLAVGDIIEVVRHIVVSVSDAGVVDLSDDFLGATVTDTD